MVLNEKVSHNNDFLMDAEGSKASFKYLFDFREIEYCNSLPRASLKHLRKLKLPGAEKTLRIYIKRKKVPLEIDCKVEEAS